MFGLKDTFVYLQCDDCGCLQIEKFPDNISIYYPDTYYSFIPKSKLNDNWLISCLKRHRAKYSFTGSDIIGAIISTIAPYPGFYEYFKKSKVNVNSCILDVGCGYGKLLLWMRNEGFKNLLGIDPYIVESIHYPNGLSVLKKRIEDLDQKFDLIMFHHSFEHMMDPYAVSRKPALS